ncbi:MAG: ATP-binding protein [Candidatus Puniceispirillales bacterium]|nr:ATP-binding protein [Alphaproteobacteria bacterium]MBL6851124.1 ATP-binding protein [Alphaproteobacteria bacterium]MDA0916039.1 ATP-binding protein [Pseudomonadota bacterium]
MVDKSTNIFLERIANALERIAPPEKKIKNLDKSEGFVFDSKTGLIRPVEQINRISLSLLQGINHQKQILLNNTQDFAENLPANNALLWGARGTGKSSLVKAVHAEVLIKTKSKYLKLVEIHREDISELPELLSLLSQNKDYKFILLCDDLSFDAGENTYKSLKAALDGGIEGKPNNVIFYATSNRRHLMPRDMMDNERSTAINPSESVEEKVSLSDRFGLWVGFHNMSQDVFLEIVYAYCNEFKILVDKDVLRSEALEWSITRGARSGRVAWQFVQGLAGKHKVKIN